MTISTTTSRVSYSGNGTTTAFSFPYPFTNEVDLVVILVDADGTETTQTLTTHYTTTGAGSDSGGTVTMITAPSATQTLVIYREVAITQETDYITGDAFPAETHEAALDKLTQIGQQLDTRVQRTVRLSEGDTGTDVVLPTPEAGKHLAWNATGDGLVNDDNPGSVVGAAYTSETQTATAGQTSFTLTNTSYTPGVGNLNVYIQGVRQDPSAYTETSSTVVTFSTGLDAGDSVQFVVGNSVTNAITDGSAVTYNSSGTGAVQTNVQAKLRESVSVKDFGAVGDGVTDDTSAIQAAIDAVLASHNKTLYFPAGNYKFSQLVCRDATGSGRAVDGKIRFLGDGNIARDDAYNGTDLDYGTILTCSETGANNGIIVSDNNTSMIDVQLENLTIIYGGTGYAIESEYCPKFRTKDVTINITSNGGNGIYVRDAWYGHILDTIIQVRSAATSTGTGINFAATLFAGLFTIEGGQIDGFAKNFHNPSGSSFANLTFNRVAIQNGSTYGIHIQGALWNVQLRNVYFEGACTNQIKLDTETIRTFSIDGIFVLGGSNLATHITGAAVDIAEVLNYSIKNVMFYRAWTAFLNVTKKAGGATDGGVENFNAYTDGSPGAAVYMFTGHNLSIKDSSVGGTNLNLIDDSALVYSKHNGVAFKVGTLNFGDVVEAAVSANAYDWNNATARKNIAIVTATGGGAGALRLPTASSANGIQVFAFNSSSSTQNLLLRNGSDNTTIHTLTPGDGATCVADSTNNKWLILPAAFSYGP